MPRPKMSEFLYSGLFRYTTTKRLLTFLLRNLRTSRVDWMRRSNVGHFAAYSEWSRQTGTVRQDHFVGNRSDFLVGIVIFSAMPACAIMPVYKLA